ncbi:MAG: DUF6607 family protein [Verrucomicrobiota bacterium]
MQRRIVSLLLLTSASFAFAAAPEQDRQAILQMAGQFKVSFNFEENYKISPGYKELAKPYHEEAIEVVSIAEDTPDRITLQHLLVVGKEDKSRVIKHWAQVWTWQDTRILDYSGHDGADVWERHVVTAGEAEGRWSQLVTSVDDTPRYESLGRWVHRFGESVWTSEPTRRPLPRREYETRDDYDYLVVINSHILTPRGWIHAQDNRKVVDRGGMKYALCHETGLNAYERTEDTAAREAVSWWSDNATVWNSIRNFWIDAGQQPGPEFSYLSTQGGTGLSRKISELEKSKPESETVIRSLAPYLSVTR